MVNPFKYTANEVRDAFVEAEFVVGVSDPWLAKIGTFLALPILIPVFFIIAFFL